MADHRGGGSWQQPLPSLLGLLSWAEPAAWAWSPEEEGGQQDQTLRMSHLGQEGRDISLRNAAPPLQPLELKIWDLYKRPRTLPSYQT